MGEYRTWMVFDEMADVLTIIRHKKKGRNNGRYQK